MDSRTKLLFVLIFLVVEAQANGLGCFEESVRRRHFCVSPGDYHPESTTPLTCMASCGSYSYSYAAVTSGKFCYCANTLPSSSPVPSSNCDIPCVGDSSQMCGGSKYVNVFSATERVTGLSLTSDAAGAIIPVLRPVTLDVSTTSGKMIVYKFDYDDGSATTGPNVTDMLSTAYAVPGEYTVRVYATDVNQTYQDQVAATVVRVDAPPGKVDVRCDSVFATYEEGVCTGEVWWGSSLSMSVAVSTLSSSSFIEDPPLSLAGPAFTTKVSQPGNGSTAVYLLHASEFSETGIIIGWEIIVDQAPVNALTGLLLKPVCSSGSYCYSQNLCTSSCESRTSIATQCPSSDQFCIQAAKCQSRCTASPSRYASHAETYEVVQIISIQASTLGYAYLQETTEILVQPGYILGLQQDNGSPVLARVGSTNVEGDLVFPYVTNTVGKQYTVLSGNKMTIRHAIRAIASGGSKVHLPFTFLNAGNFTLTVTATSKTLTDVMQAQTTVVVLEGVNASCVTGPLFGITGVQITFTVEPHTGNNVHYNWSFGDGNEFTMTLDQSRTHSFSSVGTYLVNVTTFNAVSQKSNYTEITIQDSVVGLVLSTSPTVSGQMTVINMSLTSGSDYACLWNFGDQTGIEKTDDVSTPVSGASRTHRYGAPGTYNVTVTCANNVSSSSAETEVKVQEVITNLRMLNEGASKGQPFYLEWLWDSGTDITFTVTFDGQSIQTFDYVNKYQCRSSLQPGRPPATIPLTITASNLVSNKTINLDFKILTAIVNPTFISSTLNTTSDEIIVFTFDMDAGSDVTVSIDYGDMIIDTYNQPPSTEWAGSQTFNHEYHDGALYPVVAKFSNAAGTISISLKILIRVGVGAVGCVVYDYSLYHPPAVVNLTFVANALPTDPVLTINWGEPRSSNIQGKLELNTSFFHTYGDTGTYPITVNISNFMGSKTCKKNVTVVEKLNGTSFPLKFPAAAIGLPFSVLFCLYRGPSGDLCNLTVDFGDGSPPQTFQRQGFGKDGCDTMNVTYADNIPKTIKVTATSVLETISDQITVPIINGIKDAAVIVTANTVGSFGSSTNFMLQYNDAVMPDTAFVKCEYGDGSSSDAGPFAFSSSGKYNFSHIYVQDGEFSTRVVIYNDATSVEKILLVGVYKHFSNLKAQVFYLADIPPNAETLGLSGRNDLFPSNKPVHFRLSDDNNAYATSYDIDIAYTSGVAVGKNSYSTSEFAVQFNETGDYHVSITARNPVHNATVSNIPVSMIELVEGLSLEEDNSQVKVNEVKIINVNLIKPGTSSCLYIHFGDGYRSIYSDNFSNCIRPEFMNVQPADKGALTKLVQIQHVYTSEGYFTVSAIAENIYSSMSRNLSFSITGLDCDKPDVDINNRKNYFTHPAVYRKGESFEIEGSSSIRCAQSYSNLKSWRIFKMNETYDTIISGVSLNGLDSSRAALHLPARFLDLGLYKVYYLMTMSGPYGSNVFEAETYTYIKIVKSDLVPRMMKGGITEIWRGTMQTLFLDPVVYSLDPDVDPNGPQGLTVANWTCEMLNNESIGCGAAGFTSSGLTQTLNLGALVPQTYRIRAFLQKDTRTALAEIFVNIVQGNPPLLTILPAPGAVVYQLPDGYKILKSSSLPLDCVCENCNIIDSSAFNWTIGLFDYRWPNSWRILVREDLVDRVLGLSSNRISIQPSLFDLFNSTLMRVECEVTINGESGKVAVNLQVNTPPVPGNCTVSPQNRTITTEEAWTVEVAGWADDDGIDMYQFYTAVQTDSSTVNKQITTILTSQANKRVNVSLSEGPDYNNYQQNVLVKVRDTLGGSQIYNCGTVVVRSMSLEEIRALTNSIKNEPLNELMRIFAEGDLRTCTEKATNVVSLLNSDSKQSRSEYAGQKLASNYANSMYGQTDVGRPSYMQQDGSLQNEVIEFQMESERNNRAQVRSMLINEMMDQDPQSVLDVLHISSFMAEATVYGDEIDQASQNNVIDTMTSLVDFIEKPSNTENVPIEDIEVILKNVYAVIGNIMDSAGISGFYGLQSDLKLATKDERFFIYDTSIKALGSVDDYNSVGTYDEALKLFTARINMMRQADTASIIREKTIKMMETLATCFSRFSVVEQVLEINTLKMKQVFEKTDVGSLMGRSLTVPGSEGGVVLPNITLLSGLNSNDLIVTSLSQSTNYPVRYSDMAAGISPSTNYISISFYDSNNTELSMTNLAEPIKVVIPRDANVKEQNYSCIDPIIPSWCNLMNYVVVVNRTKSCIIVDFSNFVGRKALIVTSLRKPANIAVNISDDSCNHVGIIPQPNDEGSYDEDSYRYFLDSSIIGDYTGPVYIGMRELNASEFNMNVSGGCASLPRYANGSDNFRGNICVKIHVEQCLAISSKAKDWSTDGCEVGRETNSKNTVCYCNHMTTFAGGWVVVPNTIDWNYVFANADFLTNPTIYITVIITAVLYLIFAVLARYKDKKMAEKLGISPLADNDPKDKYFYEIIVSTGMRRNAGTDSQVCFILSGEDDETDVRAFSDGKRKIFRRGQIDGFLMAVPRPLGYLNFMRIWHDNSGHGKFGSWYLNYIIVRDIQTDFKQIFIANRWFAVEEDDGQVDRVIPVANQEQLGGFSYQFGERSRKNFADGHLWYSVVARPPQSRFTCLQRVSCCLSLLYVTMLANAMFYNTATKSESASNSFSFGPFSLSPEQIFIGVVSNLIVFPVNFLLVFLFKKSRPHYKRPSRIDLAIKEVQDQHKHASINDVKPEVSSIFSVSKTPTLPKDPQRPETSLSRPGTAASNISTEELMPTKKKKKFELPWYFTIIAWILLWVVTLGSVTMVIFYGISFKDETCKKWITSMIISFFMSVFVTQPIKVILFAIILSLIIKNPGEEKEDEEEDEEMPCIDQDNELLHGDISAIAMTRPQKIGYKPPDPQLLEKLREKRLKEIKMWAIIREVVVYAFFLWILMVISYRQMGASNFLYKDTLYKVFIENKNTKIDFGAIRNTKEFWTWATSGLVNGLRAGPYYNDYPPLKLRAYINDKVSRILGYATMRQLRIKPAQCEIPDQVKGLVSQCNVGYDMFDQEERTFRPGWKPVQSSDTLNDTRQEYTYNSASDLNGYPYWGILSWYSGGGYVVALEGSKDELIQQMEQLQAENWIDRYTRAIFVEFTVYNPQVNLFAICTVLAEIHPSGGLVASVRFEPAMLLPFMTSAMLFQIVCEIVYILFTLFFIVREIRELFKARLNYFRSFWNLVEIGIIAMSISAIIIFFYRLFVTNELTKTFKDTNGNGYVKFQYVAYWNETFSYMIGFLCFLATIKFLKLLRFNRKMSMLSATLSYSANSLIHFGIIFLIVFLAFAQLFYLTYMHVDIDYATFVTSMVSGVLMMMGRYDIHSMIMTEPVLTQIFVLLFVLAVTFILVNMFVSILDETFSVVREDINKQGNDYEIVDFMLRRFKQWTGLGGPDDGISDTGASDDLNNQRTGKVDDNNTGDHVGNFPGRIERLLQTLSSVYMDNDGLTQLYQKKPYESQGGNKNLMRTGRSPSPAPGHKKRRDSSDVVARVYTH